MSSQFGRKVAVVELEKLLRFIAAELKQRGREILTQYPITPLNLLPYSGC